MFCDLGKLSKSGNEEEDGSRIGPPPIQGPNRKNESPVSEIKSEVVAVTKQGVVLS